MINKFDLINGYFEAHIRVLGSIDNNSLINSINLIEKKFLEGKKIITCGNGGSASTASHYITDWNKMINLATGRKFRGISLCDNIGLITAYANDICYKEVFSGQLKSLMDEGDLVIAISGSGNSENVISAVEFTNDNGGESLAIVGYDGGKLLQIANNAIHIPSFDMQICEDFHFIFGHLVMKSLCNLSVK